MGPNRLSERLPLTLATSSSILSSNQIVMVTRYFDSAYRYQVHFYGKGKRPNKETAEVRPFNKHRIDPHTAPN